MPSFKQKLQQDINDLIKRVSASKSVLLTQPLLVDFFDGDHNAALLMNQVLYWTDRTSDPDGWFYKTYHDWEEELRFSYYQVQRVIYGDERVQTPKRNLSEVGLETVVRMAPNGRNATYYRLDVPQFVGMFVDWLERRFGEVAARIKDYMQPPESEPPPQAPPERLSPVIFGPVTPVPDLEPTERVKLLWEDTYFGTQTIADAWRVAQSQLEIQFDRASFNIYLKRITLVDYEPSSQTFTLAVKDARNIDVVRQRLHLNIRRVLSDVFEQETEIIYVTYDEWQDRHR